MKCKPTIKKITYWLIPTLLFGLFAPITPTLDLLAAHYFYQSETGFCHNHVCQILFDYGEQIGFVTGGVATLFFILSFFQRRWKKWQQGTCAIMLTLIIGAGLLTNTLLKGYWGRPRPKQIEAFGGKHPYRPFWKPSVQKRNDPQKSFPSGHVAMGFYFLSFYLVGKRMHSRILYLTGIFLTLLLGGGLMVTRVAQGGHFLSDVVASSILMWLVAHSIDYLIWESVYIQRLFANLTTWLSKDK